MYACMHVLYICKYAAGTYSVLSCTYLNPVTNLVVQLNSFFPCARLLATLSYLHLHFHFFPSPLRTLYRHSLRWTQSYTVICRLLIARSLPALTPNPPIAMFSWFVNFVAPLL